MALNWNHNVLSGLNGDIAIDSHGANAALNSGWYDLDLTTNGNLGYVRTGTTPFAQATVDVLYMELALSGSPTSNVTLLTGLDSSTPHNECVQINSSKQVEIRDGGGILLATSAGTISTSKASPTKLIIVFKEDPTTSETYVWLVFNGTEDTNIKGFDTGRKTSTFQNGPFTMANIGMVCPAGSNPGVTLSFRKYCRATSGSGSDDPSSAALPDATVVGGQVALPPASDTTFNWTNSTSGAGLRHNDVDDYPTNDGDTTSIWDSQTTDPKTAHDALFTYTASNPLTASDTVVMAQWKWMGKLLGASKTAAAFELKVGGTTDLQTTPSIGTWSNTAYSGFGQRYVNNPHTSAAWAETDFAAGTIVFGFQSIVTSGIDAGPRVTMLCGPEIVKYSSSLSLLSAPGTTGPPATGFGHSFAVVI